MTAIADTAPGPIVRWHYLGYSALALAVMMAAVASHDRWFLNFVHVISGALWTGIDLFMGFVMVRAVSGQIESRRPTPLHRHPRESRDPVLRSTWVTGSPLSRMTVQSGCRSNPTGSR